MEEHANEFVKETNDYLSCPDEAEGISGSCIEELLRVIGDLDKHILRLNGPVVTLPRNT